MLLRIQSSEGCKRIEVSPTESIKSIHEKIEDSFNLKGSAFSLHKTRDRKHEILAGPRKTVKSEKLLHGDMLFLRETDVKTNKDEAVTNGSSSKDEPMDIDQPSTSSSTQSVRVKQRATKIKSSVKEDEIDEHMSKLDGRVERKMNPQLCRHKSNNKCIHCTSLDSWDATLMKEKNTKHLSFHAYLRKLTSGVDKGKFTYLEDLNCRIKPGCTSHLPWPQGICSKCQPSGVTLNRQTFRHIDNITFENAHIVERFINYWRVTGHQRIGFLYGKHQPHLDVPLGIKASIAAIYEPPQEGTRDHVKLLADPNKEVVELIANQLGLSCMGWIFSDLVPMPDNEGKVKCTRSGDTFFLSAHEVIMAGHLQQANPNPCKLSPNGYFGSKFGTVVVTGDKENQIHMEGYQVSNQCQSLVRDEILIPTRDKPQLAYVKESSSQQYIPDVYFMDKDQYGNNVVKLGRPLPVEYLLLDCPVSTPNEPIFTFSHSENPFPVENRMVVGCLQDFSAATRYFGECTEEEFLSKMSDFHFLIFLATMDMLPLKDHLKPLLQAIVNKDSTAAVEWRKSEQWATVEQLMHASRTEATSGPSSTSNTSASGAVAWTCAHCTFINESASDTCDMCHLPR